MLSNRCKLLGGVLGFALLVTASSPAFAEQQAKLTPPGEPSGDVMEGSTCWPWCSESLSNQVVNDQNDSNGQGTQNQGNGGNSGGGICDII